MCRCSWRTVAVCAMVCLSGSLAFAQRTLTLSDVLAQARERAPQIVSARLALDEARAGLVGASLRLPSNPEVDAAAGPRRSGGAGSTDIELGVFQPFEPGSRRSARIAVSNAAIAQASANVAEVTRVVLRAAAAAYARVQHADARVRIASSAQDLASTVLSIAERRFRAGDIAVLDVHLARGSLARSRAEREAGEAARGLALGELRQLLGLDEAVAIDERLSPPGDAALSVALQMAAERPEVRALEAGVEEAVAQQRLGQSFLRPEYGVGLRYAREGGDHIVVGGLTVTLPVFSNGQAERASGSARAARLRAELDAARARIRREVQSAFDVHTRRLAALRVLESDAVASLDESEQLATRSFDVGQISLSELLSIRREILDTRVAHLDALLEAVLARIDLDASAAMLR
jgi:cobalt-zinc-cadmium efflux system outer membrane protein